MSKSKEVNGTELIRRYNPCIIISAILGIALFGILALYLFLPANSINYVEFGNEVNENVTGLDFFKALFARLFNGTNTGLGDKFFTFLRDPRGTDLNNIQEFLVHGINGKFQPLFVLTIALFFLVVATFGVILLIISLRALMFGRLNNTKAILTFSKIYVILLTIFTIVLFTFNFLYNDLMRSIVMNSINGVSKASVSKLVINFIYVIASFVAVAVLSIFYKQGLKDKAFVKKVK